MFAHQDLVFQNDSTWSPGSAAREEVLEEEESCRGMQGTLAKFPGEKSPLGFSPTHHQTERQPYRPTLKNKLLYVTKF